MPERFWTSHKRPGAASTRQCLRGFVDRITPRREARLSCLGGGVEVVEGRWWLVIVGYSYGWW